MGRLFIENEHEEYDSEKIYYCSCCKKYNNLDVEICSVGKCTTIECETVDFSCRTFLDISFNNIYFDKELLSIELHPNSDNRFVILDLNPIVPAGLSKHIFCKYCQCILGWVCVYHTLYDVYKGVYFIKKEAII